MLSSLPTIMRFDDAYVEGFVECGLERIGEDGSHRDLLFRDLRDPQRGCIPPSTDMVCAVMNGLATSEHTACAASSGLPSLPTGTILASFSCASSSSCPPPGSVPPPSIRAGATALTVTPCGASEAPRERVSPIRAA